MILKVAKEEKGITLIALVITIIVLLILAGVTIATLIGNNGLLNRASEAKTQTQYAERKEKEDLTALDFQIQENTRKKVTINCNTLDYTEKNGIIRFYSNDKTVDYNKVVIEASEVEFSLENNALNVIVSCNEEYCLVVAFNPTSKIIQYMKMTDSTKEGIKTISNFAFPDNIERFKLEILNNGNVKVSCYSNKEYKEIYEIDLSLFEEEHNNTVLGLMLEKNNIVGWEQLNQNVILNVFNNHILSNLNDKKISFIGDSITNNSIDNEGGYVTKVSQYLGANYSLYGVGGSAIEGNNENSFVNRITDSNNANYTEIDKDTDVIFILGGTNEDGELGTIDDNTKETFYGAYKILIEYCQKNYPNSKIVLGTPIKRADEESNTGYLKERTTAIQNLGYLYNLQVVDLYNNSGITSDNATETLKDGTHPTTLGYELMADCIVKEFQKISFEY